MDLFDTVTELALDPFQLESYLAGAADTSRPSPDVLRKMIGKVSAEPARWANGAWSACFACSDPGHDDFPVDFPDPSTNLADK